MNKADIAAIAIMVIFTGAGLLVGFSRGMAGFLGVFFGSQLAFKAASDPAIVGGAQKCVWTFVLFTLGAVVAGFLFNSATHFTPIEAMDSVFGGILGFLMGWGVCYFTFHYYLIFQNSSEFSVMIWDGQIARAVHDVAPYAQFMGKMERFRNPHVY